MFFEFVVQWKEKKMPIQCGVEPAKSSSSNGSCGGEREIVSVERGILRS